MDEVTPPVSRPPAGAADERRAGPDRRQRHWYGLVHGHSKRRRHEPRRDNERHLAVVDWHHPQWLLVSMLIVMLSVFDAFATLTLMSRGARELNPFMAPLLEGSGHAFAWWKLGLTISGVVVLTALARIRLYGVLRVGVLLYLVLAGYLTLVAYECWLLWGPHGVL